MIDFSKDFLCKILKSNFYNLRMGVDIINVFALKLEFGARNC